jgi:nucleotide sugar dehydrogenase
MNKKIAIIGHGYVGQAVERFFKDHFEIKIFDPKYDLSNTKEECNACDLAVVCVPTPMKGDHSVDLSIIGETIDWLETPLILIKSTIPPFTTQGFARKEICFSPEYIGEGKYQVNDPKYPHPTDMKKHSFHIVGGHPESARAILEFFKTVAGPEAKYIVTDAKTAELTKYMENSWGATKVVFCNEFAKIAETFGVDYDELRELWLLDGRVERMHTAVFKNKRGFGGKCYPKDVNGIVEWSKKNGYEPKLLEAVLSVNEELKTNQS